MDYSACRDGYGRNRVSRELDKRRSGLNLWAVVHSRGSRSIVAMVLVALAACFALAQDFAAISAAFTGASELANSDRIDAFDAGDMPVGAPELIDADSDSDDDQDDVVVAATVGRAHVPTARTSAIPAVVCISVEHRFGLERPPRA